jgi:hypothetical protein
MLDKDHQEPSKKKRNVLLWLVDPCRETKAVHTGAARGSMSEATKNAAAMAAMPPL